MVRQYDLTFAHDIEGVKVEGTVCSRKDDLNGYFSIATKQTLCHNVSGDPSGA
jgi:hypothetical protein